MEGGVLPKKNLEKLMDYLMHQFDGYPYHEDKDPRYFSRLIDDFPSVDIEEELKQFHAWTLDQSQDKTIYYRSRFRSWLKKSMEYKQSSLIKAPIWLRRCHVKNHRI